MIGRSEILAIRNKIGSTPITPDELKGVCDGAVGLLDELIEASGRMQAMMLGRQFGHLKVITKCKGEVWFCRCSCGNAVDVEEKHLLSSPMRIACGECDRKSVKPPPWRQDKDADCECKGWDAGGGSSWLAVYGLFARRVFEEWKKGNRPGGVHHPKCPIGMYGKQEVRQMDSQPKARYLDLDNKYARWVHTITDDELAGLLWLVGEFAARSTPQDHDLDSVSCSGDRRRVAALKAISEFKRKPMGIDAVRKYIRETLRNGYRIELRRELEKLRQLSFAVSADDAPRALEVIGKRLEELVGGDGAKYCGLFNLATAEDDEP